MRPILTAAETQALDRETEARGIPISLLMERAGHAVAQAVVEVAGGTYGKRVVIFAGKGNNGGDGFVAARYLARWGMRPVVVLLADAGDLRPPADGNFLRLGEMAIASLPFSTSIAERELSRADAAVDALFGSGFRGRAEGPYAEAIGSLNVSDVPVVAVDIPSGVEGDTGMVRGPAVRAEATVSFGAPKAGAVFFPGASYAGLVEVVDIGFPEDLLAGDLVLVEPEDVISLLPVRAPDAHKRSTGVVLVVAGSRRMPGAASLVGLGAYAAGAGLVQIAAPEGIMSVVQTAIAEATFLPLPEGPAGSVAAPAWEVLAPRLETVDAVALGPGLSTAEETPEFVRRLVRESPVPVVVDADAINAFEQRATELPERASDAVLTPHTGEFGRLFGMPASEVLDDRVGFARKAAAETRAVLALKGPRTLVALPDGEVRVNPTGSSALATGGSGDVLTGAIAGYLARGLSAAEAATVACFVHGLAGEAAGDERGEGTTSRDVATHLGPAADHLLRHRGGE